MATLDNPFPFITSIKDPSVHDQQLILVGARQPLCPFLNWEMLVIGKLVTCLSLNIESFSQATPLFNYSDSHSDYS